MHATVQRLCAEVGCINETLPKGGVYALHTFKEQHVSKVTDLDKYATQAIRLRVNALLKAQQIDPMVIALVDQEFYAKRVLKRGQKYVYDISCRKLSLNGIPRQAEEKEWYISSKRSNPNCDYRLICCRDQGGDGEPKMVKTYLLVECVPDVHPGDIKKALRLLGVTEFIAQAPYGKATRLQDLTYTRVSFDQVDQMPNVYFFKQPDEVFHVDNLGVYEKSRSQRN